MEKSNSISALSRKQFRETMLVLIIASLSDTLCGVVDGIFVGRFLGEQSMAAHGIAMPVFMVLSLFSYIIFDKPHAAAGRLAFTALHVGSRRRCFCGKNRMEIHPHSDFIVLLQ